MDELEQLSYHDLDFARAENIKLRKENGSLHFRLRIANGQRHRMKSAITKSDAMKLAVVGQRLRDIFSRDKTNPIERGTNDYVIRSVIEALRIHHLFYEQQLSPFVPLAEETT